MRSPVILILWIGIALLGFVTVAPLGTRLWWGFELFAHFRVHYLALSAVLIATALLLQVRTAALAAALLGLPHLLAVAGVLRLTPPAEAAAWTGAPGFTLTTLNLLHSNTDRHDVFAFVASVDPDVLVLQEADRGWIGQLEPLARRYPYAVPDGWRNGHDVVVFSRLPIQRWEAPSSRVVALSVGIGDQSIDVLGVHARIPLSPADAATRAEDYAEIARRSVSTAHPVVAAGDFNGTVWSPLFQDMLEQSVLAPAGPLGIAPTWQMPGFWPLALPIDHVLARNGLTATHWERGPDVGSDHRPLTVRFELRG